MGINEVTKYLEATATSALVATKHGLGENASSGSISGSGRAIVLICRDVRPASLLEHLHVLVALTGARCVHGRVSTGKGGGVLVVVVS